MEDYKLTEEDLSYLKQHINSTHPDLSPKIADKIYEATWKGYGLYLKSLSKIRNPKILYKYRKDFLLCLSEVYLKNGKFLSKNMLWNTGKFFTEAYMIAVDPKFFTVIVTSYAPIQGFIDFPEFSSFIFHSSKNHEGKFYTEIHVPEEELDEVIKLLEKYYLCHTRYKSPEDRFIYNWRSKLCLKNLENL